MKTAIKISTNITPQFDILLRLGQRQKKAQQKLWSRDTVQAGTFSSIAQLGLSVSWGVSTDPLEEVMLFGEDPNNITDTRARCLVYNNYIPLIFLEHSFFTRREFLKGVLFWIQTESRSEPILQRKFEFG